MEAANPNRKLYSEVDYRGTNKSVKDYPYLTISPYNGRITTSTFKKPPGDQVKIEYAIVNIN